MSLDCFSVFCEWLVQNIDSSISQSVYFSVYITFILHFFCCYFWIIVCQWWMSQKFTTIIIILYHDWHCLFLFLWWVHCLIWKFGNCVCFFRFITWWKPNIDEKPSKFYWRSIKSINIDFNLTFFFVLSNNQKKSKHCISSILVLINKWIIAQYHSTLISSFLIYRQKKSNLFIRIVFCVLNKF